MVTTPNLYLNIICFKLNFDHPSMILVATKW